MYGSPCLCRSTKQNTSVCNEMHATRCMPYRYALFIVSEEDRFSSDQAETVVMYSCILVSIESVRSDDKTSHPVQERSNIACCTRDRVHARLLSKSPEAPGRDTEESDLRRQSSCTLHRAGDIRVDAGGTLPHFLFTPFYQTIIHNQKRGGSLQHIYSSDAMVLKYKPTFPRGTKQATDDDVKPYGAVIQYTVHRKNKHASITASPGVMQAVREQKKTSTSLWVCSGKIKQPCIYLSVEFSTQAHSKHTQSRRKGR